jgi:hypothetical protein
MRFNKSCAKIFYIFLFYFIFLSPGFFCLLTVPLKAVDDISRPRGPGHLPQSALGANLGQLRLIYTISLE